MKASEQGMAGRLSRLETNLNNGYNRRLSLTMASNQPGDEDMEMISPLDKQMGMEAEINPQTAIEADIHNPRMGMAPMGRKKRRRRLLAKPSLSVGKPRMKMGK